MIRAIPTRLADERGFGMIEVLVSALVVGLAVVGVFVALDAATATSGQNKARNVAANLAEADQERLRGMKVADLSNLRQTTPKTIDGGTYTVNSRTDWVNDKSGTQSCTSADSSLDYLKLTTTVTSPKLRGVKPVTTESIQAVPNGTFPNQGSVVVQITNRSGTGVSGLSVTLAGANTYSQTTNVNGCVIFAYVPVGTYTLSFGRTDWVEATYPNRQNVSDSVVVSSEQTSRKAYMYDTAGSISVVESAGNPISGNQFTVFHTQLTPINSRVFAGTTTGNVLFPFSSMYSVWAGACGSGNPTLYTGQTANPSVPPSQPLTPGGSVTFSVRQPALKVTLTTSATLARNGTVVVKPTVAGCAANTVKTLATTSTRTGTVTFPVPYGPYTVCGQQTDPTLRKIVSVTNDTWPEKAVTISLTSGTTSGACP
jgi:Tfp pilus assembly protein PilV